MCRDGNFAGHLLVALTGDDGIGCGTADQALAQVARIIGNVIAGILHCPDERVALLLGPFVELVLGLVPAAIDVVDVNEHEQNDEKRHAHMASELVEGLGCLAGELVGPDHFQRLVVNLQLVGRSVDFLIDDMRAIRSFGQFVERGLVVDLGRPLEAFVSFAEIMRDRAAAEAVRQAAHIRTATYRVSASARGVRRTVSR